MYEVESCVQGHHVYKTTGSPTIGEELDCQCEHTNTLDPYVVVVKFSLVPRLLENLITCPVTYNAWFVRGFVHGFDI